MNLLDYIIDNGGRVNLLNSKIVGTKSLYNPSIINIDDKLYMSFRSNEYTFFNFQKKHPALNSYMFWYPHLVYDNITTNYLSMNYICEIDNESLEIKNPKKVLSNYETRDYRFNGAEDLRLFVGEDGNLSASYSVFTSDVITMNFCNFGKDFVSVKMNTYNTGECEKNWMPVIGKLNTFIRKPFSDIVTTDDYISFKHTDKSSELVDRGSTQMIKLKNDTYIGIVHHAILCNENVEYKHRFIITDNNFKVIKTSSWFSFVGFPIEFTCGMCILGNDFIIPFSVFDSCSFIMKVDMSVIFNFIDSVEDKKLINFNSAGDFGVRLLGFIEQTKKESLPKMLCNYIISNISNNKAAMIACRTYLASIEPDVQKQINLYVGALCDIKDFDIGMSNKYLHMLIGQDILRDYINILLKDK